MKPSNQTQRTSLPRSLWILTLVAAAGAGCTLVTPVDDPTEYYVLRNLDTTRLAGRAGLVVLVGPVTIPEYLNREEIAVAGPQHNLELNEFHVWAENLDRGVARVVAANLAHLLGSPGIAPYPAVDPPEHDFKVTLVLRRFEPAVDGLVRLDASYTLSAPREAGLHPHTVSRSVTTRVANRAPPAIADAMSRALSDLSRAIGRDLLAFDRKRKQAGREKRADGLSIEPRD